jgi:hypothetical protein
MRKGTRFSRGLPPLYRKAGSSAQSHEGGVMKQSLLILTVVAAGVATAPATSPARSSACTMATLPRAASAGEQTLYGHIRSLKSKGRRFVLRFDPAWFLTGTTATRAKLEDTGSGDVANDVYVRDESHRLLTYLVPATARVTVLTHATCSTRRTVAALAKSVPSAGFWILIRNDTVRSIDQQYRA